MLIRETEYSECEKCHSKTRVKDEAHGCDQCQKVIDFEKPNIRYHDITVFAEIANTRHIFCSVECTLRWLKAFKPPKGYRFISLPLYSGRAELKKVQESLK